MKTLLMLLSLVPYFLSSDMPDEWSLVKEQDGIKMYNRPSPYSKFNDIKVVADFTGTLKQIAGILADVEKYTEWAYGTKTSVIVKKISATEPANDRDFYAHCKIMLDSATYSLKVVSVSIKDYLPPKKNVVRIPLSKGNWNITAVGDKKIHLEYTLELDPGGNVPPWLLNLFSTNGPMETFENLKKKLKSMNK
jgi:hypothetical protein